MQRSEPQYCKNIISKTNSSSNPFNMSDDKEDPLRCTVMSYKIFRSTKFPLTLIKDEKNIQLRRQNLLYQSGYTTRQIRKDEKV